MAGDLSLGVVCAEGDAGCFVLLWENISEAGAVKQISGAKRAWGLTRPHWRSGCWMWERRGAGSAEEGGPGTHQAPQWHLGDRRNIEGP